jgi:hypothetical protein
MMLRNLVDEVVRRRLWPIPLVALAVVVAAPLLFLKSAPPQPSTDATVASAAADADLPARARRLLTTTDAEQSSGRRLASSARDPFQAPASRSAAAKKASKASTAKSSSSSSSSKKSDTPAKGTISDPVPVIILTPKGTKTKDSTSMGTGTSTSRSTTSDSDSTDSTEKSLPTVDVRFGAHKDSPIHRRIPRLKTFEVGGDAAVIFVKYSPSRHKAVFAINPTTTVRGDNRCRRQDGVCSYVDIPAGSYARLTFTRPDGSRVSRRLDVVRVGGA